MQNVKETSKVSYGLLKIFEDSSLDAQSKLSKMQKRIIEFMDSNTRYTRKQLSVMTGMETSTIAGRINELVKSGAVEIVGKSKCPITNKTVESVQLTGDR